MTHSDAGRYAAKHGKGGSPDEKIAAAVREKAHGGELACADAERISGELGVTMAEVGRTADLLEIRIGRCQLGLFGYDAPGGRIVRPAEGVGARTSKPPSAGVCPAADSPAAPPGRSPRTGRSRE